MEDFSLSELDLLVTSGIWNGDRWMIRDICRRFLELSRNLDLAAFGTDEFWEFANNWCHPIFRKSAILPAETVSHCKLLRRNIFGISDGIARGVQHGGAITRGHKSLSDSQSELQAETAAPSSSSDDTANNRDETPGYNIHETGEIYVKKYRTRGRYFNIEFTDEQTPLDTAKKALNHAIQLGFENAPDALVGLEFGHEGLTEPILVPFSTKEKLTTDNVMNLVGAIMQSAKSVKVGNAMSVRIVTIDPPKATGTGSIRGVRLMGVDAPCIGEIETDNLLCVPSCIAFEMARKQKCDSPEARQKWEAMRHKNRRRKHLREAALELMSAAGISYGQECGIRELEKLQVVVPFEIKAWFENLELFFEGDKKGPPISLLFYENHCRLIRSLPRFLKCNYYCHSCNVGYSDRIRHRCSAKCSHCFDSGGECQFVSWRKCTECQRRFPSDLCFKKHLRLEGTQKKTICQLHRVCTKCHRFVGTNQEHHCGEVKCPTCKMYDNPVEHEFRCYMKPLSESENARETKGMICFDFESNCENRVAENTFLHKPNLCVAQKVMGYFSVLVYCNSLCCSAKCSHCFDSGGECQFVSWRKCTECQRRFPSDLCFKKHLRLEGTQKKTICQLHRVCTKCHRFVGTNQEHHCGEVKCPTCKMYDNPVEHEFRCYMKPLSESENARETKGMICFDFESNCENRVAENTFLHKPNLCVAQKFCRKCQDGWTETRECANCGEAEVIFDGEDCTQLFLKWLLRVEHIGFIVFAHNGSSYDFQFVLEFALRKGMIPKVIPKGLSLLSMDIEGIRFLDSHRFMPMALSALPSAFGFQNEVQKGAFPFAFNTVANQKYVGEFPPLSDYCPDRLNEKARAKLLEWYQLQAGKVFDFAYEIRRYCQDDVNILRQSIIEFKRIFMESTGVDPFQNSCTIAGACSRVFRELFLEDETIGIVPHQGYRRLARQSIVATQWLEWQAHSRGIYIEHSRNIGEFRVGRYSVDGYCREQRLIFEFHGCCWHGCQCIKQRHKKVPGTQLTMTEAYNRTLERSEFLTSQGFELEEIWECQYNREMETNLEMAAYIEGVKIVSPLSVRGAFCGGRTNPAVMLQEATTEVSIKYADYVSLYSTVLKQETFPLGHPVVITEEFQSCEDKIPYFGLMKCDVLAPKTLYHPVLPYRSGGKLLFPLCAKCCEKQLPEDCPHTDYDRQLHGEWVTEELQKAVEMGYRIIKVYEVWEYERKSDPTEINTFFSGYVNLFLAIKAQSSDYPAWVKNEEDKVRYIDEFESHEGIRLDPTKIQNNPGLRSIAKLCLNAFWGKFGQSNNHCSVAFIRDPKEYFALVTDPSIEIRSIMFAGQVVIGVSYRIVSAYCDALPNTSPTIAAFVTAYARLRLYRCLELLGKRVLYYDTDGVIYTNREGEMEPEYGETLGYMTDEIAKEFGDGAVCKSYVGCAPKAYGLQIIDCNGVERTVVKVKGYSLDYASSVVLNFDSMVRMVLNFLSADPLKEEETVLISNSNIVKTSDHKVLTRESMKLFRVLYTKRRVLEDGTTLPWGYCSK